MLSGNDCEYLEFHRFSTPQTPIVFDCTWLETHDLHINWTDRRIESWSFFCLCHCLDYASCQFTSRQPILCQICHWCAPSTTTWDKFFCKEKMLFPSQQTLRMCHWSVAWSSSAFNLVLQILWSWKRSHGNLHQGLTCSQYYIVILYFCWGKEYNTETVYWVHELDHH